MYLFSLLQLRSASHWADPM